MTIFSEAAHSANLRDKDRIERAKDGKGVDHSVIRHQVNEQFHDRIVRACLQDVRQDQEITDALMAVTVAAPEVLLQKCFQLGWGPARRQPEAEAGPPPLLEAYQVELNAKEFSFVGAASIEAEVSAKGPIRKSLICHGLSPTPDTILLLADIGRAARLSHALRLPEIHVMLADVSWVRHNRSVLKYFQDETEYIDRLRICQDKRLRIYKALSLQCDVFSISAYVNRRKSISAPDLQRASNSYRELAKALWGERALLPHDRETKALIGQTFNGISSHNLTLLPAQTQALLQFPKCASALEASLSGELRILRSLSELFSSFDEDIFIYYFAQFFAQSDYDNFLKMAVCTEGKFDSYFEKNNEHFSTFGVTENAPTKAPSRQVSRRSAKKMSKRRYVYFPQYQLSGLEVLPYSSLSLDVVKSELPLIEITKKLILLDDCGEQNRSEHMDKIISVLRGTSIGSRNRLISDLLSFSHLLVTRIEAEREPESPLGAAIYAIGKGVGDDIFSKQQDLSDYPMLFSNWMTAIDREESFMPFHLLPFTWDEERWSSSMYQAGSTLIFELLTATRRICE